MDWIGDHALQLFVLGSVFLFIFYPLFCVFLRSFHSADGFTLSQYAKVISDESTALWRSVFVGSITSVLCTILSVVFALFISTRKGWQKYLFMALLIVIMVSPPFVSSLSYFKS